MPEKKSRRVNVEAMLRREEQAVQENVRVFEAAVARHLAEQRSAIDAALGLKEKADNEPFSILSKYLRPDGTFDPELWDKLPEAEQKRLAEGIASGLIDWNAEAEKLARLLHPIWKKTYDKGAEIAGENYGLYHVERPEFVSPAKINGGKRIVGIEKTTRDKIADIIADGVSAGLSQSTLKKAIQAEMKDASKARVKTIARQETMTTLAMGQFDMMKAAGARAKTWHHREQKNPRDGTHGPNHIMLEGETVGIDERFSNGLRYPRDPEDGRAEEVINCRCYLTYSGF